MLDAESLVLPGAGTLQWAKTRALLPSREELYCSSIATTYPGTDRSSILTPPSSTPIGYFNCEAPFLLSPLRHSAMHPVCILDLWSIAPLSSMEGRKGLLRCAGAPVNLPLLGGRANAQLVEDVIGPLGRLDGDDTGPLQQVGGDGSSRNAAAHIKIDLHELSKP